MNESMKEAIKALYPPRPTAARRRVRRSSSSISSCDAASSSLTSGMAMLSVGGGGGGATRAPLPNFRSPSFGGSPPKRKANKSRFSELLLEHGEKHIKDWAVTASSSSSSLNNNNSSISNSCQMKQLEGRLRLCSQSILFEPRHSSRGIIRIPFRYMAACPSVVDNSIVTLRSDRCVIMKTNNVIAPYEHVHLTTDFRFKFAHSSPQMMISLIQELFNAESSTLTKTSVKSINPSVSFAADVAFDESAPPIIPMPSFNDKKNDIIEQISELAMAGNSFDTTNFLHIHEQPLTPVLRSSIKTPLLEEKGSIVLTDYALYFQPAILSGSAMSNNGNIGSDGSGGKAQVWCLEDVVAFARRYDGMKDRAVEIYLSKMEGGKSSHHSVLLALDSTEARERLVHLITKQCSASRSLPIPCYTDRNFVESAVELWLSNQLNNYEYLLILNSAAGRSFHDLSRYPVFPWVLSSYGEDETMLDLTNAENFRDLSKPIGALNEDRFQEFKKRYESMVQQQKSQGAQHNHHQDAPFMYGTHYSAPGYILFYLLRVMPEHMLCLQNGKFDVPDRLFFSMQSTYESALSNNADLKELIPEFYDPDCFDFLINSMGLQLGNLQTGERVDDVILPSYAKSAKDFLRKNRAALESDHCTTHLPKWIDLIFGVTSRGSRAKTARNLFHPMSYLGPVDLDALRSDEDKNRAELQATEFGIVPDKLFRKEHPGKGESWEGTEGLVMPDVLRDSYNYGASSSDRITKKENTGSNDGFSLEDGTNPFA
ncbi:BEACH domain-containing protein [Skeletonema marinoi]|uniref:BEACH domain-containing protein n=1 Tax=Skeletonema marinoi TaxID=267567 RepID=A0AAD9DDL9_9STRA|nr:BEACH domain-containing protein [Skeletonema marinoi]